MVLRTRRTPPIVVMGVVMQMLFGAAGAYYVLYADISSAGHTESAVYVEKDDSFLENSTVPIRIIQVESAGDLDEVKAEDLLKEQRQKVPVKEAWTKKTPPVAATEKAVEVKAVKAVKAVKGAPPPPEESEEDGVSFTPPERGEQQVATEAEQVIFAPGQDTPVVATKLTGRQRVAALTSPGKTALPVGDNAAPRHFGEAESEGTILTTNASYVWVRNAKGTETLRYPKGSVVPGFGKFIGTEGGIARFEAE